MTPQAPSLLCAPESSLEGGFDLARVPAPYRTSAGDRLTFDIDISLLKKKKKRSYCTSRVTSKKYVLFLYN